MAEAVVEEIPDVDAVSRQIDYPHKFSDAKDLLWDRAFMFSSGVESVVWRRYAVSVDDVHAIGCDRQAKKAAMGSEWKYVGAITAVAGHIRGIQNARGNGFSVHHRPEDDQGQHHAEIERRVPADGAGPSKSERIELREMLAQVFGPLEAHSCIVPAA